MGNSSAREKRAVAVVNMNQIHGTVLFEESGDLVKVIVELSGLPKLGRHNHGIHIHRLGDMRKGCTSTCTHFNPTGESHGGRNSLIRHVGDLGNIVAVDGQVNETFYDHRISLRGKDSLIGRCVVIHEDDDDLGLGGLDEQGNVVDEETHRESLKTGNAGARIACAVIGIAANK